MATRGSRTTTVPSEIGLALDDGALRVRALMTDPSSGELLEQWFAAVDGGESAHADAIAADGRGNWVVAGRVYVHKTNGTTQGSFSQPFVAKLGAAGETLWTWTHAVESFTSGELRDVAVDSADNIFVVGVEAPYWHVDDDEIDRSECTVYGCDGLVVHALSTDGELIFSFAPLDRFAGGRHRGGRCRSYLRSGNGQARARLSADPALRPAARRLIRGRR